MQFCKPTQYIQLMSLILSSYTLLICPACGPQKTELSAQTLFIQLSPTEQTIAKIRQAVTIAIQQIVHEELKLEEADETQFFIPKDPYRGVTLYTIADANKQALPFIEKTVKTYIPIIQTQIPIYTTLSTHVALFGNRQDELVIMINDPAQELKQLNQKLRTALNSAHTAYAPTHMDNLYNIAKSEHFSYVPHIGLGRLRIQTINQLLEQRALPQEQLAHIATRIIQKTTGILEETIITHKTTLTFDTIRIWAMPAQQYLAHYAILPAS